MRNERSQELNTVLKNLVLPLATASAEKLFHQSQHQSDLKCSLNNKACVLAPIQPAFKINDQGKLQSNLVIHSPEGVTNCLDCHVLKEKSHCSNVRLSSNLYTTYPHLTETFTRFGVPCALILARIRKECVNGTVNSTQANKGQVTVDSFIKPIYSDCSNCRIKKDILPQ